MSGKSEVKDVKLWHFLPQGDIYVFFSRIWVSNRAARETGEKAYFTQAQFNFDLGQVTSLSRG